MTETPSTDPTDSGPASGVPSALPPGVPTITAEPFGRASDGSAVDRYTLDNGAGLRVRILNYGGIVQSVETPDRHGRIANVVLGFPDLAGYLGRHPYFGALIGRYANRIAGGTFQLDGVRYALACNDGPNSLHGGERGFDARTWRATPIDAPAGTPGGVALRLEHTSPNGEESYPGTLHVTVMYTVTPDGALRIDYLAATDGPTVVNLTNHSYVNLAGEGSGTVLDHVLRLDAPYYTPVDGHLIPTGRIEPVAGTPFDFTRPARIGDRIGDDHEQLRIGGGYDHNYVVDRDAGQPGELRRVATVSEPRTGRVLEVAATEPGVQFYSGNLLDGSLVGTGGRPYGRHGGFCLETQHFPDSPNQPVFPSTALRPGEDFASTTVYRFTTT